MRALKTIYVRKDLMFRIKVHRLSLTFPFIFIQSNDNLMHFFIAKFCWTQVMNTVSIQSKAQHMISKLFLDFSGKAFQVFLFEL